MKLKDIMTKNVEIITPEISLKDAAMRMKDLNIGILPVGENDRLVGMVTDRDITIRAVSEGKDPAATKVREIMTPDAKYCFEDDDITAAAKKMKDLQIRRVLVLNKEKRVTGIISLGDMVVDSGDDKMSGEVLHKISEPAKPDR
jgi:CBS domain-containing protein